MLSTTFLFALDNTIVANIQPSIISDFGRVELLPWIGTAFALGTMSILTWGKIYGVCNIKWVYMFNILLFEVGSAICGAAPNMVALIVGRVIAGIGGSGMYSGTLTYVSVLTSMEERPAYLSGSTVIWGVGSVLGPVVCQLPWFSNCGNELMAYRLEVPLLLVVLLGDGYVRSRGSAASSAKCDAGFLYQPGSWCCSCAGLHPAVP